MKIFRVILVVLVLLLAIWGIAVAHCSILTARYGDEFLDFESMEYDFMHSWTNYSNHRVLSYSKTVAVVYYFGSDGGEKVEFRKIDDQWYYQRTLMMWSNNGGTADDYFIWTYFKDWVL